MTDSNNKWVSSIFDNTAPLKNTVFRVVGRNLGAWAWKMAESGTAILMPWAMAGGFARNTDPTLSALQNTFRYYADRFTNFRPVRWAKNIYQGADGIVSGVLSFSDSTINRLNLFPGFRLLTGFPLFLGNWEQKYKQMKNFVVLRALWDYGVQPVLKTHLWTPYSTVASIYAAPYADAVLRVWDENLSRILGENYKGGENFSLSTLQGSCASGWKEANFMWRGLNYMLCGGGASTLPNQMHEVFSGVSLSTAGIEKLAEGHLETLGTVLSQGIAGLNTANQYIIQGINNIYQYGNCLNGNRDPSGALDCTKHFLGQINSDYVQPIYSFVHENGLKQSIQFLQTNAYTSSSMACMSGMATNLVRYHDCVLTPDKGLTFCTQKAGSEVFSGYVMPAVNTTWNVTGDLVSASSQYIWENALKTALNKTTEMSQPYVVPAMAVMTTSVGLFVGYKLLKARLGATVVNNVNNVVQPPAAAAP